MPSHIRQDLPLELSELPDELIYAADLSVFEFSGSEAVHLAAESHEALVHHLSDLYGGAWPPEADDAARATWEVRRTKKPVLRRRAKQAKKYFLPCQAMFRLFGQLFRCGILFVACG